jgi:signal transduction histidine kinase
VHVIRGRAEQLQIEYGDDESVDIIIERTERLVEEAEKARMVEDIVAGDIEPRPVDLADAIRQLSASFAEQHDAVRFDLDLPESVWVHGNELLPRAFENLIENAIEHNDSDAPTVTVTLRRENGLVTVEIVDDGPGIPSEEAEIIDQGEESALRHSSGLGLWVSNWLVEEVDGDLTIESTDVGTVARVQLRTPADEGETAAGATDVGQATGESAIDGTESTVEDD